MSVSRTSSSAPTSTATWAARKSLSPKEISSVAVVSFSLITGSTRQSSSVRERLARVQVVRARAHVEERQQHLRARHAAFAQQLVVDAVQLALPDGARRLQLPDRARALAEAHHPHAARDRAARDDDRLVAAGVQPPPAASHDRARARPCAARRRSSATTLEPSLTTTRLIAGSLFGPARRSAPVRPRGSSSNVTPPISISSPGSKPCASSALHARRCAAAGPRRRPSRPRSRCRSARAARSMPRAATANDARPEALDAEAPPRGRAGRPCARRARSASARRPAAGAAAGGARTGTAAQQRAPPARRGPSRRARGDEDGHVGAEPLAPRRGLLLAALGARRDRPSTARGPAAARARRGSCAASSRSIVAWLASASASHRRAGQLGGDVEHVHEQPRALDVGEEVVPEPGALARALDQPRDVGHDELAVARLEHAEHRLERRERVVGDLRRRARQAREQRGLARVRAARRDRRRPAASDCSSTQPSSPGSPRSAKRGAWRVGVAKRLLPLPARPAARDGRALPVGEQLPAAPGQIAPPRRRRRHLGPGRDADLERARRRRRGAGSPAPWPPRPARNWLRRRKRLQVAQRVVADEHNVAAAPAVAAVRAASGHVRFAAEAACSRPRRRRPGPGSSPGRGASPRNRDSTASRRIPPARRDPADMPEPQDPRAGASR